MRATAEYVGSVSGELAELANQKGLHFLAYLLKLAEAEAGNVAGNTASDVGSRQARRAGEDRPQAG